MPVAGCTPTGEAALQSRQQGEGHACAADAWGARSGLVAHLQALRRLTVSGRRLLKLAHRLRQRVQPLLRRLPARHDRIGIEG